jgi:hypothetical protein
MSIQFKTEGHREFQQTFRRYEQASSKSFDQAVRHRVGRFGFTLFRLFNREARKTRAVIRRTPARIMRSRDSSRTQRQEKARRIFSTGFAAAGWLVAALSFRRAGASARGLNPVKNPRGKITLNLRSAIRSADLINFAPGAKATDNKHGLTAAALRVEVADMEKYLQKDSAANARRHR